MKSSNQKNSNTFLFTDAAENNIETTLSFHITATAKYSPHLFDYVG